MYFPVWPPDHRLIAVPPRLLNSLPFRDVPGTLGNGRRPSVPGAEWMARGYRTRTGYRVVVEGLLSFDADRLDGVRERTAQEIVEHLRKFFPKRARPREGPVAPVIIEFDAAVAPSATE